MEGTGGGGEGREGRETEERGGKKGGWTVETNNHTNRQTDRSENISSF